MKIKERIISRSIKTFIFIFLSNGLAIAQELSSALTKIVPRAAEKLRSPDIKDRISVLDTLVKRTDNTCMIQFVSSGITPSDYSVVVRSVLEGRPPKSTEVPSSYTWMKINYLVREYKLKEVMQPLVERLLDSDAEVDILATIKALQFTEAVPHVVKVLDSKQEYLRHEALRTLVSLHAKEAIPALLALLQEKDGGIRKYALDGLVEVNAREAAPEIAKVLDNTQYWAVDALVKLGAREQAPAIWKLINTNLAHETEAYALAALISFGESRAIPLAVKRATENDMRRRNEMLEFLVQTNAYAIASALVAVLESRDILGGDPNEPSNDINIRNSLIGVLGKLQASESVPVLRAYARGEGADRSMRRSAVLTLGNMRVKGTVGDLVPLLDEKNSGDTYLTAEAGLALAKIGDRSTWPALIDLAAKPPCPYRGEIINELNRHLDGDFWERIQKQEVQGLDGKSVKNAVEALSHQSGIPINLEFQPAADPLTRFAKAKDGYPWANTNGARDTMMKGLQGVINGLNDNRKPELFAFVFDGKQIQITSVNRAVAWWRKHILSRA